MVRECLVEAGELMVVIRTPNWKRVVAPDRLGFPHHIIPRRATYTIVRTRVIIYYLLFYSFFYNIYSSLFSPKFDNVN